MRRLVFSLILVATPAFAELTERQQGAYDAILPGLTASLIEQGGEVLRPMAPLLAGCIVTEAKRRELKALVDGEISEADNDMLNEIMTRPKVQGCVAKAAIQG